MKTRYELFKTLHSVKNVHDTLSLYSNYNLMLYYPKGILMTIDGVSPTYIRSITADGENCVLADEFGYYIGTIHINLLTDELLEKVVWYMEDIVMEMDNHLSKIHTN